VNAQLIQISKESSVSQTVDVLEKILLKDDRPTIIKIETNYDKYIKELTRASLKDKVSIVKIVFFYNTTIFKTLCYFDSVLLS